MYIDANKEAKMAESKRERLIEAGLKLFYERGFNATGIDAVLAEAGVAKMTLYKHFRSKDDLIVAVLRRRDEVFRNWLSRAVERLATTPRARLLALFDAHHEWFESDGFRGCMFINAAAEFGQLSGPIHTVAGEHKWLVIAYIGELTHAAGATEPGALALQLCLLLDGATAGTHVTGDPSAAGAARAAAETLIDAAIG
jgi:AcrR family transcriptional regulator